MAEQTLREFADRYGRSLRRVRAWSLLDGFPRPTRTGPRGVAYYDEKEVDDWAREHFGLGAPGPAPTGVDPDERVNMSQFARMVGVTPAAVHQYRGRRTAAGAEPMPEPGPDGLWRLGALWAWWSSRPGQGAGGGRPPAG